MQTILVQWGWFLPFSELAEHQHLLLGKSHPAESIAWTYGDLYRPELKALDTERPGYVEEIEVDLRGNGSYNLCMIRVLYWCPMAETSCCRPGRRWHRAGFESWEKKQTPRWKDAAFECFLMLFDTFWTLFLAMSWSLLEREVGLLQELNTWSVALAETYQTGLESPVKNANTLSDMTEARTRLAMSSGSQVSSSLPNNSQKAFFSTGRLVHNVRQPASCALRAFCDCFQWVRTMPWPAGVVCGSAVWFSFFDIFYDWMSLGYYAKERTDEAVHWTYGLHSVQTSSYSPTVLLQKGSVGSILYSHLQLSFCKLGFTMIHRQFQLLTSVFKSWLSLNKIYPLFKCTHCKRFSVILLLLPMLLLAYFGCLCPLSVASFFHRAAAMSTAFAVAAPQVTTPGIKAHLVGIGMSPRESLNKQPRLSFEFWRYELSGFSQKATCICS